MRASRTWSTASASINSSPDLLRIAADICSRRIHPRCVQLDQMRLNSKEACRSDANSTLNPARMNNIPTHTRQLGFGNGVFGWPLERIRLPAGEGHVAQDQGRKGLTSTFAFRAANLIISSLSCG